MSKQSIRLENRTARLALNEKTHKQAALALKKNLCGMPAFERALRIAAYYPQAGEADTLVIIEHALSCNKAVYLPKVNPGHLLTFHAYDRDTTLQRNQYQIFEPELATHEAIALQQLDLVLVPLLAFDDQCHRLGMGKGYYDRTFSDSSSRPQMIGIALEIQKVATVPTEKHDIVLDAVVTEKKIYTQSD